MGVGRALIFAASVIFCFLLRPATSARTVDADSSLHVGFYERTCPQAENITSEVISPALQQDPTLAAALLRLFFHDCFVTGCDASILLDSTPSGEPVEKASPANGQTLRGLELIDEVKARIEKACPGVVSCADIVAFASRDAVVFSGSSLNLVPSGRRDGRSSRAIDVADNLPPPSSSVDHMIEMFTKKGLTVEEMVVLFGAHSIGKVHCGFFDYRLYNYSSEQPQDPKLDKSYAFYLKTMCPPPSLRLIHTDEEIKARRIHFDRISPFRLDNSFYVRLMTKRTLLQSDQGLVEHPKTRDLVRRMASEPTTWAESFAVALVRLGRLGVLTGNQGEIRKNCRVVN